MTMNRIPIQVFGAFICSTLFQYSFGQSSKVETDSSIIETLAFPQFNSINIFNRLKNTNKVYYTKLYYDTRNLKEQGIFVGGSEAGKWREFFQDGKLKREIDYDNGGGVITYFDKSAFPFLELQSKYKKKGDSIIKKIYGEEFLTRHVAWNMSRSYIYNNDESGNWRDEFKEKPTRFLLRYNVILDNKMYDDLIEFEINEKGQFIPGENEDIYGFEQLSKNSPKLFIITDAKAIELAKQKGLTETDSTKAVMFLSWKNFKPNYIYNGKFRFYVIIRTASLHDSRPGGWSGRIDEFDAYVFNPWTTEFIEKKKMNRWYE